MRGSHENKNKYRFRENGNNNQFIENGEHRNKNSHNKGQQYTHDGIFKNKFRIHRYQKLKECIQKHQKKATTMVQRIKIVLETSVQQKENRTKDNQQGRYKPSLIPRPEYSDHKYELNLLNK